MNEEHPTADDYRNRAERAERQCEELMAENARLREVGNVLADFAEHANDCAIVTHGVWSDPIPCTCGYTEAWQTWMASGGCGSVTEKHYVNRTYPTAWCSICGPGECEHNRKFNEWTKKASRVLSDDMERGKR